VFADAEQAIRVVERAENALGAARRSRLPGSAARASAGNADRRSALTLRLGQINERMAPITIMADGLARLGFAAPDRDRSVVLYHESDFSEICHALIVHVRAVQAAQAAQAA